VGHRLLTPDFAAEMEEARLFYTSATPDWRLGYLRRKRFTFVVLPKGRRDWLAESAPLTRVFAGGRIEVFRVGPSL
jgi:hypothetical protein